MNKIKVLFLAANPADTQQLRLDEEIREITAKIRAAEHRDALEVVSRWAVRPDDLQQALLEHRPHIVHFSGHGTIGQIILTDEQGKAKPVGKAALASLFKTLKDDVRVVMLNACYSRDQASVIVQHIDCVIGMNQPIGDRAAITFAASFYRALGFRRSVQEAFDLGRTALLLESIPEENTPELLVRKRVNPAKIILVNATELRGTIEVKKRAPQGMETPQEMDRLALVRVLTALSPTDLATLIMALRGAAAHVSRNATVPEQVAELLRWVESSTGPGLAQLQAVAKHVLANFR